MHDFVILHHVIGDGTSHWDLMLRAGEELLTWSLETNPLLSQTIRGKRLANHRLKYLTYEGAISGNRGTVKQIAKGKFKWLKKTDLSNWEIEMMMADNTRLECRLLQDRDFELFSP